MSNIQEIETSVGTFMADRVEFYENGVVKSAEPEQQVFFSHETGLYIAYDNTPLKDEEHLPTLELNRWPCKGASDSRDGINLPFEGWEGASARCGVAAGPAGDRR